MPESHQLTLDLFDSTARASGWTLDVPCPAVRIDESVEVATEPTAGGSSTTETVTDASGSAPRPIGHNYYLAGDRDLGRPRAAPGRDARRQCRRTAPRCASAGVFQSQWKDDNATDQERR